MKILALLLSLILSLPGGTLCFSAWVEGSDVFSVAALDGMNAALADARLVLSPEGYDLWSGDDLILWARPGVIASGDAAAPFDLPGTAETALEKARALGALLAEWEVEKQETVDLQEAGTARRYLRYVLGEEGFARMIPRIAELLELPALAEASITGKATLRRYFDREGNEFGAYFYAEKLHLNGVTREVRLEYGYQPEKGLYLAFRCPDSKGQTNTRLSLHMKRTEKGWSVTGEARDGTGVYTAQGRTYGTLTLTAAQKEEGKTLHHTLALDVLEDGADFAYTREKTLLLTGTMRWNAETLPDRVADAARNRLSDVAAAFAGRLLEALRQAAPDSWQQILHDMSPLAWVNAQKEEQ